MTISYPQFSAPLLLSNREVEVLTQWLISDSKREAAAALFISTTTVNTHMSRIRAKYAEAGRPATTKVALLVRAIEDGYLTLNAISAAVNGEVSDTGMRDNSPERVSHLARTTGANPSLAVVALPGEDRSR